MSAAKRQPAPQTPDGTRSPASVAHSPGNGHPSAASTKHWTIDPAHPTHIAAKTQRCPLCKASPGEPCQNIARRPLYGDRLHNARTEAP